MTLHIGNACGFWGDDITAPARLLQQEPHLDFLTLDYLAEVSLSIMAIQKEKDPQTGYAQDFIEVVRSLVPYWKKGGRCKIVTNAGGLNPLACAEQCVKILKSEGLSLKVAAITGDSVLAELKKTPAEPLFNNLDTKKPLTTIADKLVTANAYIGAKTAAVAIDGGADIIIGGRIADPSLTVAPCLAHFKWSEEDYSKLAGATIAGHLIECGTQATGGISTNWLSVPSPSTMGFPIAEIDSEGNCILTKPKNSGGVVNEQTVKEQLLYEIDNPARYLSPDVTVSFLNLNVEDLGQNRVAIKGALGSKPTNTYKVNATYRDGFKCEAFLTLFGKNAIRKAKLAGEVVLDKLRQDGFDIERHLIECLGGGDLVPGMASSPQVLECVLRIAVADSRMEALALFSKEIAPLVTSGPQGTTGYSSGRPKIRPIFGFWPCLIPKSQLSLQIQHY